MRALLVLALIAAPAAARDDAPVRVLTVHNDTSAAVNQLFVGGERRGGLRAKVAGVFGTPDDDRDRLDAKLLPAGGSIVLQLKGERCRYDLRAVLVDGRTFITDGADICAQPEWAVSGGTRR